MIVAVWGRGDGFRKRWLRMGEGDGVRVEMVGWVVVILGVSREYGWDCRGVGLGKRRGGNSRTE